MEPRTADPDHRSHLQTRQWKRPASWLRLDVEHSGRAEFHRDLEQSLDDRIYLNRLRLRATVEARPWLRMFFEGQDARTAVMQCGPDLEPPRNPLDIHEAYVEAGHSENGLQVRFGRQSLAIGDERLVGADAYWDPFGLAFDALRVSYTTGRFRIDTFSGYRVEPARRRPDPFDTASRISGATLDIGLTAGHQVQPYMIWKRGGDTRNLLEDPGHRDVFTPGIRAVGDLPGALDYNIEVATQRGHVVTDKIAAWAGHWEAGWKPLGKDLGPRIGVEYNYASGDRNPADGSHGTFDDLYPAGFNKYGITDPYAWRNIRSPSVGIDMPLTRHWSLYGAYRSYWLATVQDGLYPGGDEFIIREPNAPNSHIGTQAFLAATYTHSERWHISAGYGHLFPGGYLRRTDCASGLRSIYLSSNLSF